MITLVTWREGATVSDVSDAATVLSTQYPTIAIYVHVRKLATLAVKI